MRKFFGTDGIRGKANDLLTPDLALKVGMVLGSKYKNEKLVLAKDPRQSSDMLEHALASGIAAAGADVYLMGVASTPALAYVVRNKGFKGGVMISASHNPYYDNGLKIFSETGLKISSELESEIESYLRDEYELEVSSHIGKIRNYPEGIKSYITYIESTVDMRLDGYKIVLDCAHGAATSSAGLIFSDLGAEVILMNNTPNGTNINDHAGSTHMTYLQNRVVKEGADFGFAFDGDADRVLASDHLGNLIDGDKILYILAKAMKETGHLPSNTVVSTVMANLGFIKAMEAQNIAVIQTGVGDRYVAKEMYDHDYTLGGEQSGHILLKEYATTGDGILTALKLAESIVHSKKTLYDLSKTCVSYPQILENIILKDKDKIMTHPKLLEKIKEVEHLLKDQGRILVRASGTEPLIRVMVEAKTDDLCALYAKDVVNLIENL